MKNERDDIGTFVSRKLQVKKKKLFGYNEKDIFYK